MSLPQCRRSLLPLEVQVFPGGYITLGGQHTDCFRLLEPPAFPMQSSDLCRWVWWQLRLWLQSLLLGLRSLLEVSLVILVIGVIRYTRGKATAAVPSTTRVRSSGGRNINMVERYLYRASCSECWTDAKRRRTKRLALLTSQPLSFLHFLKRLKIMNCAASSSLSRLGWECRWRDRAPRVNAIP